MKQMAPLIPQLITICPTRDGAAHIAQLLDEILDGQYKVKTNPFEEMHKKLPYSAAGKLLALYYQAEGLENNPVQLYGFLSEVKDTLKGLPPLSLQIAVEPTQQILETITTWVIQNLQKHYLLDITVKKDLLAGAAVGFEGHIKDYSLLKKLPQLVSN